MVSSEWFVISTVSSDQVSSDQVVVSVVSSEWFVISTVSSDQVSSDQVVVSVVSSEWFVISTVSSDQVSSDQVVVSVVSSEWFVISTVSSDQVVVSVVSSEWFVISTVSSDQVSSDQVVISMVSSKQVVVSMVSLQPAAHTLLEVYCGLQEAYDNNYDKMRLATVVRHGNILTLPSSTSHFVLQTVICAYFDQSEGWIIRKWKLTFPDICNRNYCGDSK